MTDSPRRVRLSKALSDRIVLPLDTRIERLESHVRALLSEAGELSRIVCVLTAKCDSFQRQLHELTFHEEVSPPEAVLKQEENSGLPWEGDALEGIPEVPKTDGETRKASQEPN